MRNRRLQTWQKPAVCKTKPKPPPIGYPFEQWTPTSCRVTPPGNPTFILNGILSINIPTLAPGTILNLATTPGWSASPGGVANGTPTNITLQGPTSNVQGWMTPSAGGVNYPTIFVTGCTEG